MKIDPSIKDSPTLKFAELAREKNRRKERVISLGLGEPCFETPAEIVQSTYEAIKSGYTRYSNPSGLPELRELIRDKLLRENGIAARVENIIITPGAKQAMLLALMSILEPGDEVINITPCYVSYLPQIKIAEPSAIVHNIDLIKKDFSLDLDGIKRALNKKTKAIILNFPHNPTGKMLSDEEIAGLSDILKRTSSYIISDEVYEKLNFSGMPYRSIGSIKEFSDRAIVINGFSKTFNMTGWRIGYLVAPKAVADTVSRLQQHINTNTCTFIQKGSCAAFSLADGFLKKYNSNLKDNADNLDGMVRANGILKLVRPQGGLFAFLDISDCGIGSDDFCASLLSKKNVVTIPGVSFGENWDDHIRISLVTGRKDFAEGVSLIDSFVKELI